MNCVTDNELVELLEERLAPERRAHVLAELERCADCRALAKALAITWTSEGGRPRHAEVPDSVAGYEIEELLGAGAMGLVFRARDRTLDRQVAIKIMRASNDEGRLLATVRHPNVITVHAAGAADDLAYLVMELAEGTSLDKVIAGGAVPWRQAARWFGGVASGLAAVHAAGVVHRDVKPGNLLVDRDELRIADFGLASRSGGAPAGTLAYLAPEVAERADATARSDQFAFAVTLFEAVTGRRPFAGSTVGELRAAWRAGVASWDGVPPRLRAILERALAHDPEARWPDMTAIERALAAAIAPRRWPWLAAAAGVVVVGGVVAASAWRADSCRVPEPGWTHADPQVAKALASYAQRWSDAYARACERPTRTARDCLDEQSARVAAIAAAASDANSGVRALAALPGPAQCLGAPRAPASSALARRVDALWLLGKTREAWAALPPPERDDAELALLRGQLAHGRQELAVAETALRRAAELASTDDNAGVLGDAQSELGLVVGYAQDRHDAGAAYADLALQTALRTGDRRRAAIARGVQGMIAGARGHVPQAVAALTASRDELAQAGGEPLELATAEIRLGMVLRDARRHGEARPHFTRARELRVGVLGEAHPLVATADVEIGIAEAAAGDFAAAMRRYRAVIDRIAPGEAVVESAFSALGTAQVQTGDYPGAEASFARTLALRRAAYGERHIDVAHAQLNLASTYYYEGKLDAAIEAYRAADALARSLLGAHHPEVATVKAGLALALQGKNQLAEATAVIDEVIAIYRELPGHDLALGDALQTRGMIAMAGDKLADARTALEASYAIQRGALGDDHVDLASIQSTLGELYLGMHRVGDAERLVTTARALRVKHGAAPQLVAENDFLLAMIAWEQGQKDAARAHARAARERLGDARPELAAQIAAWLAAHR